MTIPQSLRERFDDPAFWAAFFYEDEDRDDDETLVPEVILEFAVGGGCRVVLDIDGDTDSYELGIATPGSDGVRSVGWDDLAHCHPFAFRWAELDLICRAVAALDPAMPHPGPALALLCRFVSVHDDDDVEAITAAVHKAFESLRPHGWDGYWPDAAGWLKRSDFRDKGVVWTRDPSGHLYAVDDEPDEGEPFYSIRSEPSDDPESFPYDEFAELLRAAQGTVSRP